MYTVIQNLGRAAVVCLRRASVLLTTVVLVAACGGNDQTPEGTPTEADGTAAAEGCAGVDLTQAPDEPTTIRMGHGTAAEDPMLLMTVEQGADFLEHRGDWYQLEMSSFRGSEQTLQGMQAGEFDAVSSSTLAQVRGVAAGALDIWLIASVAREADPEAFSTTFITLEGSGIQEPGDLVGKTVGINDFGSIPDFLARRALLQAGADPDRDVEFVVAPFPAQAEALRGGQIDVAVTVEPFHTLAMQEGGVTDVFSAAELLDSSFELLTVAFGKEFVENNLSVVCAWLDDYQGAIGFYNDDREAARRLLLDQTEYIRLPAEAYLATEDYARPSDGEIDLQGLQQMMDAMVEAGVLEESERVEPQRLVLEGVSAVEGDA